MRATESSVPDCADPVMREALTDYVFDDLGDGRRQDVALHLVECDSCWRELERLERAATALRLDPRLKPMTPTLEMFSVLGMSGKFDRPFGGHAWFAASVALLYGLLWGVGIWSELAV